MGKVGTRRLSKKQKEFADNYLETGNGTQSALKAYDTTDYKTASVIATENLDKPSIQQYLADKSNDAINMVYHLSQHSKQDFIKLSASKDILDRAGHKAPEKHITVNVAVSPQERDKILGIASQVVSTMTHEEIEN